MTKIDIFSGFLGAGKTTLIKKLIKEAFADEKLVLIENEFGEIGIDGGFMKEAGIQVNEMNSGCICCSLVGDFTSALSQVLEEYDPDRILIEPSGVGKLSDVIKAVQKVENDCVKLNAFTTVSDATKCIVYSKNFGEFYDDQLTHANCIILSRTDGMAAEKLETVLHHIREKNTDATIVTTPWSELGGEQILSAMENHNGFMEDLTALDHEACPVCGHHLSKDHHSHCDHEHDHDHHHDDEDCHCHEHHHHHHGEDCHCHEHHHHHHADEVFSSWGTETINTYSTDEIHSILMKFADEQHFGKILRAKGIVHGVDGSWIHFDYVPDSIDIRLGGADVIGKLCVIGSDLHEDALKHAFRI